ncbi:MAG: DUF4189 domain-containing protein [Rhodobacterales bacterium]|nr:DUF4189 domain-containing protein [Rhodobacterales bacterium]
MLRPLSAAPLCRALLGLGLSCLVPGAALAYYPCNGPGPDEIMIGIDDSNGVQTPLCEYVGEEDSGYDGGNPGGYWVDQFAALAWGQDGNGSPTYSWYQNAASMAEAENGALAQCQSSGFGNCVLATSVTNGAIAIALDKSGSYHSDWGVDAGEARRKTLRYCRQQGGKGCKIDRIIESPAAWVSN